MSFFDDLGKNITSKSQAASAAVKGKTDTIKINNAITANRNRQKDVFTELGKAYYEMHKNDEAQETSLAQYFEQIKHYDEEIDKLNVELSSLKKTVTCPNCGTEVERGKAFCSNCGNKMLE